MYLSANKPLRFEELIEIGSLERSFFLVESTEKSDEFLSKISVSFSNISENRYSIQVLEITSKNNNYSFKVELLRLFSKLLKKIEMKYNVSFNEITWFYKNTDAAKTNLDIRLLQKTFAPMIFYRSASFLYNSEGKSISLTDFSAKKGMIGKLIITKK